MSWSLEIRFFANEEFNDLLQPESGARNFLEFPFASPSIFATKIVGISHERDCILDDASPLKANRFAATARPGLLFCVDPQQLLIDQVAGNSPATCELSLSLSGAAEHLEFSTSHGNDVIQGAITDSDFWEKLQQVARLPPWSRLPIELTSPTSWEQVEHLVFELLRPFMGVNYLTYSGEEPVMGIYRALRPWFSRGT